MSMFNQYISELEIKVKDILRQLKIPDLELTWKSIPFSGQWGLSTSFFHIAAQEARVANRDINVQQRANEIAKEIENTIHLSPLYEKCQALNGYLNVYFDTFSLAAQIMQSVLGKAKKYGAGEKTKKTIMVEFSQPNTHKAFHVGHLRNIMVGSAVSNILEFAGNQVIRANYLGDIGLHVITWLWNYDKYHKGEQPPAQDTTKWIGELYAEAVNRREASPENEAEVRAYFQRWDEREEYLVSLWKETRQWSLEAFDKLYSQLGIHFDRIYFESEVEEQGKILVQELIDKNLAIDERPENAVVIKLDDILQTNDEYRVLVVLRSDGTSLYATKDIPLAIKKFTEYNLDQSIYVIDVRQSLYMKQIFKTLELMGYEWVDKCFHLAYEIVNLPGNVTLASREGTVVLLEDLIQEAKDRARVIVEEKNPETADSLKYQISEIVAIGAIKYPLLSRDNTKIVTFDWESALDVSGQASPYIQYAAVRANSILKKVSYKIPDVINDVFDLAHEEIELLDLISRFPDIVQVAARDLRPLEITNYAYNLARAFNDFYVNCPVLSSIKERNFRIRLVASALQVITNSLSLLGIQVPDKM